MIAINLYKFSELSKTAQAHAIEQERKNIKRKKLHNKILKWKIEGMCMYEEILTGFPIDKKDIKYNLNHKNGIKLYFTTNTVNGIDIDKALNFYEKHVKTTTDDTLVKDLQNYLYYKEIRKAYSFNVEKHFTDLISPNSTYCEGVKELNIYTGQDNLVLDKITKILEEVKVFICKEMYEYLCKRYAEMLCDDFIIDLLQTDMFTEDGKNMCYTYGTTNNKYYYV